MKCKCKKRQITKNTVIINSMDCPKHLREIQAADKQLYEALNIKEGKHGFGMYSKKETKGES